MCSRSLPHRTLSLGGQQNRYYIPGHEPSVVTRRHLSTRPVQVTDTGGLNELLYDDGSSRELLICAGHGGHVEPGTAELGLELAVDREAAVYWAALGYESNGGAFESWHPPSTAIDPATYPLLDRIADRGFRRVLSIHGLGDDEVLVGGGIDGAVKATVARRLDDSLAAPVAVATEVTSTSLIRTAIASPTSAPSTAIGRVTSCPPRNSGVIIGPQQAGGVCVSIVPPSATVPAHSWSGPTSPRVYLSTVSSCWISRWAMSDPIYAIIHHDSSRSTRRLPDLGVSTRPTRCPGTPGPKPV